MGRHRKWTEDDCISAVRAYEAHCDAVGEYVTYDGFNTWRDGRNDMPSLGIIRIRCGSWNQARLRANDSLTENDLPLGGTKAWTEELCLAAIRKYEDECQITGENPTRDGYQRWHPSNHDIQPAHGSSSIRGAPSIHAIESLGYSWNEIRLRAATNPKTIKLNYPDRKDRQR